MNQNVSRFPYNIKESAQENSNKMRIHVFEARDQGWIDTITDHLLDVIHFPLVKTAASLAPKSNSSNPKTLVESMEECFKF